MKASKVAFAFVTLALTMMLNECSPIGTLSETPCKMNGKLYSKGEVIFLSNCSGARCGESGNPSFFVNLKCSILNFKRSSMDKKSEKEKDVGDTSK